MTSMRAVVVAGLAAAAATGLASPAMAAPAKPTAPAPTAKAPVTPDQCEAANGRVQRAQDGVGTCVGGKDDGHLIKDVTTKRADGTTATPNARTGTDGSRYHEYGEPGYDSGYRDSDDTTRPGYRSSDDTRRDADGTDRDSRDSRDDDRSSRGLLG